MNDHKNEYVSPFDARPRPADPLAPRPASLVGARVALLDIGKNRGAEFLDRVEVLLRQRGATPFRAAKEASLAALTPEALNRVVKTQNFGELRLGSFVETFILDVIVHTWDLAQASGQQVVLPPDLVHRCFEWAKQRENVLRGRGLIDQLSQRADVVVEALAD